MDEIYRRQHPAPKGKTPGLTARHNFFRFRQAAVGISHRAESCLFISPGVINCGPPYKMTRMNGNRVKAEQLFAAKARGAKILIAPCHNCHSGLEDINHHYGLGLEVKFISDILYEVMEKPA